MELNYKRTPAFIDEKNVSTDFIYDMFDGIGEVIEHISKNTYDLVGYWNNCLIEVKWNIKSNRISFAFIDMPENHHTEEDKKNLIEFINDVDSDSSGLHVSVFESGVWIISDWYFWEFD